MVFEVPKSKASVKQNRFEFKMPNGKKYSVPLMAYMKPSLAMKFSEIDVTFDGDGKPIVAPQDAALAVKMLFEAYFPDEDLFALFEDSDQFESWMVAWTEASGVSLGESGASSKS